MDRKTIQDQVDEINRQIKGPAITDMSAEEIHGAKLSSRQILALRAFHKGAMIHEVAKLAGVSRQTLHRWRTRVPEFAQAMNSWESAVLCIARSRMAEMAFSALDALSDAIDQGDVRSATALLRSLGLLKTYRPVKFPEEAEQSGNQRTAPKSPTTSQRNDAKDKRVQPINPIRNETSKTTRMASSPDIPMNGTRKEQSVGVEPSPAPGQTMAQETSPALIDPPAAPPTRQHRAKENKPTGPKPLNTQSASKPMSQPTTQPTSNHAVLAKKAESIIHTACDGALHRLTQGYERLTQCYLRLTQRDENWTAGYIRLT